MMTTKTENMTMKIPAENELPTDCLQRSNNTQNKLQALVM